MSIANKKRNVCAAGYRARKDFTMNSESGESVDVRRGEGVIIQKNEIWVRHGMFDVNATAISYMKSYLLNPVF